MQDHLPPDILTLLKAVVTGRTEVNSTIDPRSRAFLGCLRKAGYTFSSIAFYVAARNGTNPRSYTFYDETFGDPEIRYKATCWNLFLQDDWKVTRRLKFTYGLRYDLYQIPKADAASLFPASQKFNVDKNNFAPRFGVVYALR